MNLKYLFLIPRTPKQFQTEIRNAFWEVCKKALLNQTYNNWKALVISDEKEEDNCKLIYHVDGKAITKFEKINSALKYIENNIKTEYIIRLDDDDVIMPHALEYASKYSFDALTEFKHTFYEITSNSISQQERSWYPNTVIHKYEHAITPYGEKGTHLINHDHSQIWHIYYKNKNVKYLESDYPLYVRLLSPNSITSKGSDYYKYLNCFGYWDVSSINDFEQYREEFTIIKSECLINVQVYRPNYYKKAVSKYKERVKKIFKG